MDHLVTHSRPHPSYGAEDTRIEAADLLTASIVSLSVAAVFCHLTYLTKVDTVYFQSLGHLFNWAASSFVCRTSSSSPSLLLASRDLHVSRYLGMQLWH